MVESTLEAGLVGGAQGVVGEVDQGALVVAVDDEALGLCDAPEVGEGEPLEA
jgi:hypothetical protein